MGDMPLSSAGNLAAKGLVARMVAENRAPKTIKNVIQIVKMVVASAINEEGDQVCIRRQVFTPSADSVPRGFARIVLQKTSFDSGSDTRIKP